MVQLFMVLSAQEIGNPAEIGSRQFFAANICTDTAFFKNGRNFFFGIFLTDRIQESFTTLPEGKCDQFGNIFCKFQTSGILSGSIRIDFTDSSVRNNSDNCGCNFRNRMKISGRNIEQFFRIGTKCNFSRNGAVVRLGRRCGKTACYFQLNHNNDGGERNFFPSAEMLPITS